MLQQFVSIFNEKSKIYCEKLKDKVNRGEFNIYECTAGSVLEALMKNNFKCNIDFYESECFKELDR